MYPVIDPSVMKCTTYIQNIIMHDFSQPLSIGTVGVYLLIDQGIRHPGNFQLLLDILGFRHFEVRHSGTHLRRLGALRVRMTSLTRFAHAR